MERLPLADFALLQPTELPESRCAGLAGVLKQLCTSAATISR
jgi:hypothetical protein